MFSTDASSFLLGPGPPIVTGDSERGPSGCNLFVFHLPNELTNWDLYLLFRKYGTIVSVHTMINKITGLSRGFGFVSFSKEEEAIAAVRSMDGFRLGKKRLKVQRKREHEEDDEAFGPDFENLCGQSGFSSITAADQSTMQPSSIRRSSGRSLSPLSQPQTPQSRFNMQMLCSPSSTISTRASGMSCPIGRMSPLSAAQQRAEDSFRSQAQASCDITQEMAANLKLSYDRNFGIRDIPNGVLESFPKLSARGARGYPPQRSQSFGGGYPDSSDYDPCGNTTFGMRDGEGQFGIGRTVGTDGGIGHRLSVDGQFDVGRSLTLNIEEDESSVGNHYLNSGERARERRNSDDSFFHGRLGLLNEETTTLQSAGLTLPPTSRQSTQFHQPTYLQQLHRQQHREDRQQGALQADYEQGRSRGNSITGSISTEGKTSSEMSSIDGERERLAEFRNNIHEKTSLKDYIDDPQLPQQHYVYDGNDGQYILR